MRRRNAGGSAWPTGSPSIRTSPLSGSISRLMLLSSVVLPDPEAPTNATNAPGLTVTLALRSAKPCPPSNDLLKVSISISAPAMNFASRVHVYSGLPCPANAGHPVTRGAKKGTEPGRGAGVTGSPAYRSEEHTSELQSRSDLVCRLLLE